MSEPELAGMGVSSASRRRFMWLGGGMIASLLLLPEFSLAAKVTSAVKKATGKSSSKTAASASKAKGAGGKSGTSKASAKSGSSSKAARAASSGSKSARSAASSKGKTSTKLVRSRPKSEPRGKSRVARQRQGVRTRDVASARAEAARTAEVELPPSFEPTRSFGIGSASAESRDLSLYCVHTGETLRVDYFVGGRYEPDALRAIDHLLRDYHNDEICQFDPRVLNQLYDVRRALGSSEPFHVFSGYRSPTTNENYRRMGGRVAEHSYHLTGQAIDIQLPGRDVRQVRNVAVAMRAGGVGYYPQDGFVHLDSGPVRRW